MLEQKIPQTLTEEQVKHINSNTLILLSTVDHESHGPNTCAISWVTAINEKTIRFSITNNSRTFSNIKNNPKVTLSMIGLETVYSITGMINVLNEKIEGVHLPLSKLELQIEAVFDSMFWGGKITQTPIYEKTYNPQKADALDKQVYAALLLI
ncbi:pyridoxamine 5'-phosphate oxidase family protein [Cytobacillus massiliigabonensis]|uniref:pyridoxamine 5'-phosphate oxidase family protein n=1 Tax=Cytobacillus massiliigabonensis TaxID=1871011 RepID=UPI000C837133|nr:pyridoxamine 5'-phosphate oxidase family protein [Cytobacillus massiliigabonensis]